MSAAMRRGPKLLFIAQQTNMKLVSLTILCKLYDLIKSFSVYNDGKSTPVRIIVEDHFHYIAANQKRAAESYYKLVQKQVELLVKDIGTEAYFELFSYGTDPRSFNEHATRATTTLCNRNVIFCRNYLFFITALNAVPGPTLPPWEVRGLSSKALSWACPMFAHKVAI